MKVYTLKKKQLVSKSIIEDSFHGTIKLDRTVFDKAKFEQSVDTSFSQLVVKPEQKYFDLSLATVGDFFKLYENLFYEIPKDGSTDSHEYLVKESGEYIEYSVVNEDIQLLLDEISSLREENLVSTQTIITLQNEIAQLKASNE